MPGRPKCPPFFEREARTPAEVIVPPPPADLTASAAATEPMDLGNLRRFNDVILRSMATGLVVTDRGYRMITSNPAARRLLQIHEHGGDADFLHAVRGIPYNDCARHRPALPHRTAVTRPTCSSPPSGRTLRRSRSRYPSYASGGDFAVMTVSDVTEW